jgi:hypothetical protein
VSVDDSNETAAGPTGGGSHVILEGLAGFAEHGDETRVAVVHTCQLVRVHQGHIQRGMALRLLGRANFCSQPISRNAVRIRPTSPRVEARRRPDAGSGTEDT